MRLVRAWPSICVPIPTRISPTSAIRWRRAVRSIRSRASPSAGNAKEAAEALSSNDPATVVSGERAAARTAGDVSVSRAGFAAHLHGDASSTTRSRSFGREIDRCAELLEPHLGLDLRTLLFPAADDEKEAEESLRNTQFAQPAIFAVSYAWRNCG